MRVVVEDLLGWKLDAAKKVADCPQAEILGVEVYGGNPPGSLHCSNVRARGGSIACSAGCAGPGIRQADPGLRVQARMEAAVDKRWPKMMASAQWFTAKAGDFGVKLKILIALYQMLQGIGITFNIRWPEAYGAVLRFLASIIQIDLPQAMPLDCVANFGFFGALFIRTGLPLLLIMVLASLSNLFKRCSMLVPPLDRGAV